MLFSPDGRRWRVVVAPHVPDQIKSDITVGLLYVDGDRVLAVGVDPEADEAYARSHGRATGRVVIDHAHPIVWQRTPDGAWKLLTAASTQTNGELGPAAPTQAAVEAVARVGGWLLAVGHVRLGDIADEAVWMSTDGGVSWSNAASGGKFNGDDESLKGLAVHGTTVVAFDDYGLWRAVPTPASH